MPFSKKQFAALPLRLGKKDRIEVLLVTSRGTGRWLPPKGSQIRGKPYHRCAEIEAYEEAGVQGIVLKKPLGKYELGGGTQGTRKSNTRVILYPLLVHTELKRWKECHERKRHWFQLKQAANAVYEPELQTILLSLRYDPKIPKLMCYSS